MQRYNQMLYVPETRKVPGVYSSMFSFVAEKHAKELPVECQEMHLELLVPRHKWERFSCKRLDGVSDWDCH